MLTATFPGSCVQIESPNISWQRLHFTAPLAAAPVDTEPAAAHTAAVTAAGTGAASHPPDMFLWAAAVPVEADIPAGRADMAVGTAVVEADIADIAAVAAGLPCLLPPLCLLRTSLP